MTCGPGTRTDTRYVSIRERHGGTCPGEANIVSECHDQACPGRGYVICFHQHSPRYISLTVLRVFLSTSILNLEEDYVELDEIVEDLNELDVKTDDEQKLKKPRTGN